MSLFEWIGESINPGSTGTFGIGGRDRAPRPRWAIILCLVITLAMLGGWFYLLWQVFGLRSMRPLGYAGLGTLAYLVISYLVRPEPDLENLGWLGGLIDHPFRFSDDINRGMLLLAALLLPGQFIAEALLDGFFLLGDAFMGRM